MLRVLIADDHAIYREGLKRVLEAGGLAVAGEAASGEEALERAQETHPDVVILDVAMPGRGGVETLQELKRREPRIRVLILTVHGKDSFAVRCLREGADGYLTKDAGAAEVVVAVRKIHDGGKYVSPALSERLALNAAADFDRSPHERLSRREFQVMSLMGAGKSPGAIATELGLSIKTVSTYRARMLEKMGMKSTVEVVRFVIVHDPRSFLQCPTTRRAPW
jgi:two-component system invasion response regulator UvrY